MRLEFDPLAVLEIRDAVEYYNLKQQGLGNRFKAAVQEDWQHQTKRTRRFILQSFPYKIISVDKVDLIYILAFTSSHREPDYWLNRIQKY